MTVRQALQLLLADGVDMDAELMIDAPMACSRNPQDRDRGGDHLSLPVCRIDRGTFPEIAVNGCMGGIPWVKVVGTDVWGVGPSGLTERSFERKVSS